MGVVFAVQQHELDGDRGGDGEREQQHARVAGAAEAGEGKGAAGDHRGGAGGQGGDVVGVDDALGEVHDEGLDEEPAAEHEQHPGERIAPDLPPPAAGPRAPSHLIGGVRAGRSAGGTCAVCGGRSVIRSARGGGGLSPRGPEDAEGERDQPEQREGQHPAALAAEAGVEDAQRSGGAAEGGGVGVVAVGKDRVGDVLGRGGAFGAQDGVRALRKRRHRAEVHEDLVGPPDLPFDAAEAVVAEV